MVVCPVTSLNRVFACAAVVLVAACSTHESEQSAETPPADAAPSCTDASVRTVVERFGERLRDVSLLAPDSVVRRAIREAYAPFVTPSLLDTWTTHPARAPGRTVSSPWPDRIAIDSVAAAGPDACRITGDVIYVTSVEAARGGDAARERITLRVAYDSGWRVADYAVTVPASAGEPTPNDAVDVVRRYYTALKARDFRTAYELWENNGVATGQSFQDFAASLSRNAPVTVEVGAPGRVEPAAGSRYVTVPVILRAVENGEEQRFEGTYTLRRSVVDGATADQRHWRIYSASIHRTR